MEGSLVQLTRKELLNLARIKKIKGYSSMKKDELIQALGDTAESVEIQPEPQIEAPTPEVEAAAPVAEVKAPPQLPQTWVNYDLLIDEYLGDLPGGYNEDKSVLMVIDPYWIYTYWDLSFESIQRAKERGGKQLILRVNDVTDIIYNGFNAHNHFDIYCQETNRNWYLNVPTSNRTYIIDVGYLTDSGEFILLTRSNSGNVPLGRPSDIIADYFVTIPWDMDLNAFGANMTKGIPGSELADAMYQLSGGPMGGTENVQRFGPGWEQQEFMSSFLFSAEFSRQAAEKPKHKDFWLVANAELIVYGATEPDAAVTVRGTPIQLRPDGTFSLRFALPDGDHPIPIHGVNADRDMERSIHIEVTRSTRVPETV